MLSRNSWKSCQALELVKRDVGDGRAEPSRVFVLCIGSGDVLTCLDVHDIIVLIDGRSELVDELAVQPDELRRYVVAELAALRDVEYFEYVVQSAVAAYGEVASERAGVVRERVEAIIARVRSV